MTETMRYSKIMLEDLALGNGTRSVRLADQALYTLKEINLTGFLSTIVQTLRATDFNGQARMTWSSALPANARIWGVTGKVTTAFGTTNSLTGLLIGEPADEDRWTSAAMALTLNTETDQGDFSTSDLPIYPSATDIWVSAVGGTFDTTGLLEVAVRYSLLRHP